MTRALNIKIQDAIYSQLDQHAREHNVTKTQIVEMALSQWFSGNVDEDVEDVDSSVDNVDVPSKTPKDNASYIESSNNSSNDIENIISTKIAEYLLGVTCPVPDVGNVDEKVDSSVEDVDSTSSDVDSVDNADTVPSNGLSTVESNGEDSVDKLQNGLNQGQLAQRFGCASSTINRHKKKSPHQWDEFCANNDPLSLYWKVKGKRFYPTAAPTDTNWKLTDAHLS